MEIIDRETAQYIVDTVKSVCGKDINYIDARGIIIASTDHSRVDSFHEIGYQVVTQGDTKEVSGDESFLGVQKGVNLPIFYHGKVIAAVGISGELEEARKYAALAQKITTILLREREVEARGSQKRSKISYMLRTLLLQGLTSEDLQILKVYYSQDMSLQKTCELLNMHKNTLQYRLNRIREICGYDPRRFREGGVHCIQQCACRQKRTKNRKGFLTN